MAAEDTQVRWVGQRAVVATPAEIDATNADEVGQTLLAAAGLSAEVLIIDMSGTTFCDSAGMHAIVTLYRQTPVTGTQLRLVATHVLRILTLIGADQLIPIYPTLEAALADAPNAEPGVHRTARDPISAGPADSAAPADA
jgi:anti-sigma B factor antagonist